MSKNRHYHNFYNQNRSDSNPVQNSDENQNEVAASVDEESDVKVTDTITEEPKAVEAKIGIVSNCERLNVRMFPQPTAKPVCVINRGTSVEINEHATTANFYGVRTADGIEGFCMKDYITLQ